MNNLQAPLVSVIVPTYHDWERLKICIDALSKQTYSHEKYEVIIVNNDPDDSPPELSLPDNFRIISEGKPGSYAARNEGLKGNKAEILAFIDSDCIPDTEWILNGVNLIKNDNKSVHLVAGHIDVFSHNRKQPSNAELLDLAIAFPQKKYVENSSFGVTANLFVKSEVIDQLGNFNSKLKSGGDKEFCHRAVKQGLQIAYSKDAIVKHPARKTVREIFNKTKRMTGGRLDKLETKKVQYHSFFRFSKPPLRGFLYVFQASELTIIERIRASSVLFVIWYAHFSEWFRIAVLNKKSIR